MTRRELSVTTDFYDNILFSGRHYEKRHLDDLMAYCASLAATWHEWIIDTIWTLYDDDAPQGYDLLAEACDAAHRHGMRFDAVFKPFEGALDHPAHMYPSTFPRPGGVPLLETLEGVCDPVRPFLAEHPEMLMARKDDDAVDPGGPIAAIRLVSDDEAENPFAVADLEIHTSDRHGGWRLYEGPREMTDAAETFLRWPYRVQPGRVVTLGGLALPEDTRFVMIRSKKTSGNKSTPTLGE